MCLPSIEFKERQEDSKEGRKRLWSCHPEISNDLGAVVSMQIGPLLYNQKLEGEMFGGFWRGMQNKVMNVSIGSPSTKCGLTTTLSS